MTATQSGVSISWQGNKSITKLIQCCQMKGIEAYHVMWQCWSQGLYEAESSMDSGYQSTAREEKNTTANTAHAYHIVNARQQ